MLTAIRTNDPKLKTDKPLFNDADFDEKNAPQKEISKPLTLKDQIRKHTLRKMNAESENDDDDEDDDDDDDQDSEI